MRDYTDVWQMKDSIMTVVEANGYRIWDLSQQGDGFRLELTKHIDEDAICNLCGQFPITADYSGEGYHGTIVTLY